MPNSLFYFCNFSIQFAPTNDAFDAFEAANPGSVAFLTSPEGFDDLLEVLTFHVHAGVVVSSDVMDELEIEMLNGETAEVVVEDDVYFVEDSEIIAGDILVGNGVIHIIDRVMIPESLRSRLRKL